MKKEELKQIFQNGLIVSCQALPGEPLYTEEGNIMPLMAKAASEAGAVGIRANSVRDILQIKEKVSLPIIGIIKKEYEGYGPFITCTMKEIDELVATGCEVIAFDATNRIHPNNIDVVDFIKDVRKKYPDQIFMADISTYEEAIQAASLGIDFVGTTLNGYTEYTKDDKGPNFDLLSQLVNAGLDVIAEGKIHYPHQAAAIKQLGVCGIVVGGAITRPKEITQRFIESMNENKEEEYV